MNGIENREEEQSVGTGEWEEQRKNRLISCPNMDESFPSLENLWCRMMNFAWNLKFWE